MLPVLAKTLYFALQRLRREPIEAALKDVRRTEFVSSDELLAIQAERQLAQLRFALHHVPHYQKTLAPFADRITTAETLQDVESIVSGLPVIEKGSVTAKPEEFTSLNSRQLATYPAKTSGSSGTPVIFPCDQVSWAYRHALMYRCMESFGVSIGERYALFFGLHWNKQTRLKVQVRDIAFNRVRLSAYEIGPSAVETHLRRILSFRPAYFLGYPSALYDFCLLLRERGIDLQDLGLKAVFVTAEPLRQVQRALIEEVTGARCVNTYGCAEGGMCAFECPEGALHIASEAVWLSLRTNGRSEPLAGEAVLTDMMLRAFPMIRYAMGDEVVLRPGKCSCGRPHPMLRSIEGRSGEPILLPNGRRINPNLPSYIFKPITSLGVIRRYRFVQCPAGLELWLVVSGTFQQQHLRMVEQESVKALGPGLNLKIKLVDSLPILPNAKHRDFVRAS